MPQNLYIRSIPVLFYDPSVFWRSATGSGKSNLQVGGSLLFLFLLLTSVVAGIAGRFIYALSPPAPVDFIPEAVSNLITPLVTLLVLILITHLFIRRSGHRPFDEAFIICTFSLLPYLIVSAVILLIRDLFFFGLLSLYSAYVYAQGLKVYRNIPREKIAVMTIIVLLITLVVHFSTDLLCRYITVNIIFDA